MGRLSKRKGATAERELVRALNELAGMTGAPQVATRVLGQARDGGHDITYRKGLALFEAKHRKVVNLLAAIEQVRAAVAKYQLENGGPKPLPVVAYKRDRTPWTCLMVLDLDDCVRVLELLAELKRATLRDGEQTDNLSGARD
jgi:Holliday junction resolvase